MVLHNSKHSVKHGLMKFPLEIVTNAAMPENSLCQLPPQQVKVWMHPGHHRAHKSSGHIRWMFEVCHLWLPNSRSPPMEKIVKGKLESFIAGFKIHWPQPYIWLANPPTHQFCIFMQAKRFFFHHIGRSRWDTLPFPSDQYLLTCMLTHI